MKLMQFFQDETGAYSSTRLAFLAMSATIGLVWAYVCVSKKEVVEIPPGVAAVAFTYMLGKVGQTIIEKPKVGG